MSNLATQIKLSLWKHGVLRLRQPVTTLVQLFFPSLILVIFILVKQAIPPDNFETCTFNARAGPSAGTLKMIQSFVCNIENNCRTPDHFQDIPGYKGAKLDAIEHYLGPLLFNETLLDFTDNLHGILTWMNASADAIKSPNMQNVIKEREHVSDLFMDKYKIGSLLVGGGFDNQTAEALLAAFLKTGTVLGDLASIFPDLIAICSRANIQLVFETSDETFLQAVENNICNQTLEKKLELIEIVRQNLNTSKLLELHNEVQNMMNRIENFEMFDSGLEFMNIIYEASSPLLTRRKRSLSTALNTTYTHLSKIPLLNQMNLTCLKHHTHESCQTFVPMMDDIFDLVKESVRIWKNATLLLNENADFPVETVSNCLVDVNHLVYINSRDADPTENWIVCTDTLGARKKREALSFESLKENINWTMVTTEIENWRETEFFSGNWYEEFADAISSAVNISQSLGGHLLAFENDFPLDMLKDPESALVMFATSKYFDISTNLTKSLFAAMTPFMRNSDSFAFLETYIKALDNLSNITSTVSQTSLSDLFLDSSMIFTFLTEELDIEDSVAKILLEKSFSKGIIVILSNNLSKLLDRLCNEKLLKRYILMDENAYNTSIDVVIDSICNSNLNYANIVAEVNFNLTSSYLKAAFLLNPVIISRKYNISVKELSMAMFAADAFSSKYNAFSSEMDEFTQALEIESIKEKLNISEIENRHILPISSYFLCGVPAIPQEEETNQNGSESEENSDSPPLSGCELVEKMIANIRGGNVLWKSLKPIIHGKILLAPNDSFTEAIIGETMPIFEKIADLKENVQSFGSIIDTVQNVSYYKEQGKLLTGLFYSNFFLDFSDSYFGEKYAVKYMIDANVTESLIEVENGTIVLDLLKLVSQGFDCIETEKFLAMDSESSVMKWTENLTNPFLAGIIFHQEPSTLTIQRRKRAASSERFENHVKYTIRMEVDHVPETNKIKERLWIPGPDGDFYYNLRYLWGFTQIQDLIDKSIIQILGDKSEEKAKPTFLQQFPYPCFKRDNFLSGLYTAQLIQVAIIFGFAIIVSTLVREFVWERESKNGQLIQIMGMRSFPIWLANFIVMALIFLVNCLLIILVLWAGGLMPKSNPAIILIILITYSFSLMMFVCLMYASIRKSTSGAVATFLFFIFAFLPFLVYISLSEDASQGAKIFMNLFMNSAFGFSFLYATRYEQKQIGIKWENFLNSPIQDDEFNLLYSLLFLILDGCIYGLIALAVGHFSNLDGSWNLFSSKKTHQSAPKDHGISLVGLTKEYKIGKKGRRKAVNSLTIDFEKNKITGFLGHNGAGKSTTMGMMTGLVTPTSGSIFIEGVDALNNLSSLKQSIGFCPQNGILNENLNAREHLYMYTNIKSSSKDEAENNISILLSKLQLNDKAHTLCKNLSEGLRRRLAIAIAFSGDSSVIILDEPTAGVDSSARRAIWDLILSFKGEKTIIISTHHIDEAEILCEKIAIVHSGKLLLHSETLEFHSKYSNELLLNISTVSGSGMTTEVTSLNSSTKSLKDDEDRLDKQVYDVIPGSAKISQSLNKRVYSLPLNESEEFASYQKLFQVLENDKETYDIGNFSLSSPSLEDIFIALTSEAESQSLEDVYFKPNLYNAKFSKVQDVPDNAPHMNKIELMNSQQAVHIMQHIAANPGFTSTLKALLHKRYCNQANNKGSLLLSFLVPWLLLILAMVVAIIKPDSKSPPILLTPSMYGPNSVSILKSWDENDLVKAMMNPPGIGTTCMRDPLENVSVPCHPTERPPEDYYLNETCTCETQDWTCKSAKTGMISKMHFMNTSDIVYKIANESVNSWILNTHFEFLEQRYGGWYLRPNENIVYFNNKGFHSSAAYLNALHNAVLRSKIQAPKNVTSYGISTYSHPFKRTSNQISRQSFIQHVADYTLALLLLTVVSFLPASTMNYLIFERTKDEKLVQYSFGVTPLTYWIVAFLWDTFLALIFSTACIIIIACFGVPAFCSDKNLGAVFLLILCYTVTANCMVYLLEKCFSEPGFGHIIVLTCSVFIGVGTLMIMLVFSMYWWIRSIQTIRKYLRYFFLILPPYAVGGGFLDLIQNQIFGELSKTLGELFEYKDPYGWEIIGKNLLFLLVEAFIFFLVNIIYETLQNAALDRDQSLPEETKLALNHVSKVYSNCRSEYQAVDKVSFAISRGECFGLIGLNGAGKSTIFKMITKKLRPSSGKIVTNCKRMGYCPQNNSLDDHISVRDLLVIYGTLAGYSSKDAVQLAWDLMKHFELTIYSTVSCGDLSGGNKRKVCTAISMIGRPDIILMDEPTSGMDPKSRRVIWDNIRTSMLHGQSVLLTSHSLLECDKLCDNVAIMIKGEAVYKGTPDTLREKYGKGYKINIKFGPGSSVEAVNTFVFSNLEDVSLIETQLSWVKYSVEAKLSAILGYLSAAKKQAVIDSFTIDVTSLEDIFLQISKEGGVQRLDFNSRKQRTEEALNATQPELPTLTDIPHAGVPLSGKESPAIYESPREEDIEATVAIYETPTVEHDEPIYHVPHA